MNQRVLLIIGVVVAVVLLGFIAVKNKGIEMPKFKGPSNATAAASGGNAAELFEQAAQLEAQGEKLKAKDLYQKIMMEHPDFDKIEEVQNQSNNLNLSIITSNIQTPDTVIHEVKVGDSLGKLSKQYNTTVELIKKNNNLKNDIIRVGQRLRIWTKPFSVLVNKSQNILILKAGDEVVKIYHVSTGTNNSTPVGTFKITTKLVDPVWFKSGAVIPPESPENVLGSRWMGFDLSGYGIHGTTMPQSIGQQVTAGCVRMLNREVEELYDLLPVGTEVTIVD